MSTPYFFLLHLCPCCASCLVGHHRQVDGPQIVLLSRRSYHACQTCRIRTTKDIAWAIAHSLLGSIAFGHHRHRPSSSWNVEINELFPPHPRTAAKVYPL